MGAPKRRNDSKGKGTTNNNLAGELLFTSEAGDSEIYFPFSSSFLLPLIF